MRGWSIKRLKEHFSAHARMWIGAGLGGAVIVVVGVGAAVSWWYWGEYQTKFSAKYQNTISTIDDSLGSLSSDSGKALRSLNELHGSIERETAGLCATHPWLHWQSRIEGVAGRIEKCQKRADALGGVAYALSALHATLRDDHSMAEYMAAGQLSGEALSEEEWSELHANWSKLVENLNKTDNKMNTSDLAQSIVGRATTVRDAWQQLLDAHTAKDQARYESAQENLRRAYEEWTKVAPELRQAVDVAVGAIYADICICAVACEWSVIY